MFPQLTISGAPRERGRQYGQQAADLIRLSLASYAKLFAYQRGIDWQQAQREARAYLPILQAHAPDLLDEMYGVAEGAAVDPLTIVALNARTELLAGSNRITPHPQYNAAMDRNRMVDVPIGECTTVAALPPATADGRTLLGQTWDWYGEQRAACLVLRIEAPDQPTILTVTEAGIIGKIGLNSAGVGVTLNILATGNDGRAPGMPIHVQLRRVLQSTSLDQAIERVCGVPAAASSCLTIVHDTGRAASLEVTPQALGVVEPQNGLLAHTNHCVDACTRADQLPLLATSSSEPRYARATTLLQQAHGAIDHQTLIDVLRDHNAVPACICRHPEWSETPDYPVESVLGVVLDVRDRAMYLAAGVPCQTPFERIAL